MRLPICFAALAALAPLPLQLPCRLQPPPFAARPRPRLFGSNRAAAARARVAHCATSELGGQPRAPRALPLLLSCSPHPKLGPVALYDRALALPCPIAPFRPPASRQHTRAPGRRTARPPRPSPPLHCISRCRHPRAAQAALPATLLMLRALLLLACTAKVAAFAQTPPGCVDVDPDGLRSAYTGDPAKTLVMVFEDGEDVEEVPIASCADVAAGGGCDDESLAGFCCASCALPQRMTYARRRRPVVVIVVLASSGGGDGSDDGSRI